MQKKQRVFIAINLPGDIKKALVKHQERLFGLPAKWTEKDNLHMTVSFLGDITDQELADVCKITGENAKKYEPFSIRLTSVGYGPDQKIPPKYIWAGGEKSKELSDLKNNLEDTLEQSIDYKRDGRGFAPHITLARIKEWEWRTIEPEERPEVNESIDLEFTVESIEVMESILAKNGPKYEIIESHTLGE